MCGVSLLLTKSNIIAGKLVYCFISSMHAAHIQKEKILLNDVNSQYFLKIASFVQFKYLAFVTFYKFSNNVLTFD